MSLPVIETCELITKEPAFCARVDDAGCIAFQFEAEQRSNSQSHLVEGDGRRLFFPLAGFRR